MFLLFVLACTTPDETAFDPEMAAELDQTLDGTYAGLAAPGAAAAVFLPDQEGVYVWTAGHSDAEGSTSMQHDDVWAIASLTKLYVSVVVLQLEAEGGLTLDDPLSTWTNAYPAWDAVTVRQLLSHTSGIDDFGGSGLFTPTFDEAAYLSDLADDPLAFPPGSDLLYSNGNYMLLGQVISAATGTPWREVLRTRVFDPSGLNATQAPGDGVGPESTVVGWMEMESGEVVVSPAGLSPNWASAAGEMVSTPADVASFGHALFAGNLLSAEHRSAMATELLIDGEPSGFGAYGAEVVHSDQDAVLMWKDGTAARGQRTRVRWNETTGAVVATFTSLADPEFHGETETLQQSAWQVLGSTYTP
ncbi:MAG: beta-lactamase family protein [Proteobacteria bacterium]|nr:beta-lactamase family protein [Pseudomonadota bacterium]